jgi:release factor glutamine methyltransferase
MSAISIAQAVAAAMDKLSVAGVESPRLDAELLLSKIVKSNRAGLIARAAESLSSTQLAKYDRFVQRRSDREPVAYIVGTKEFYGREFEVNSSVLIPRPETELLVDLALKRLRALKERGASVRILDVGCGSGAIGITVACEESVDVMLTDISAAALAVTASNAELHGVQNRATLIESNLLNFIHPAEIETIDELLVLANLPYIATTDSLPRDVQEFEPASALFAGDDGLDEIRRLIQQAAAFRPKVRVFLEHGHGSRFAIKQLAKHSGFEVAEFDDLAGRERVLELW